MDAFRRFTLRNLNSYGGGSGGIEAFPFTICWMTLLYRVFFAIEWMSLCERFDLMRYFRAVFTVLTPRMPISSIAFFSLSYRVHYTGVMGDLDYLIAAFV